MLLFYYMHSLDSSLCQETAMHKVTKQQHCKCLCVIGKVNHAAQESIGGWSSPSSRPWARRWRTTNVCDAWPVWCQTYGYLPSCKASPPIDRYQIILLGNRGTCVLTICPGLHSTARWLGFEPTSYWSQVRYSTAMPLSHTFICCLYLNIGPTVSCGI